MSEIKNGDVREYIGVSGSLIRYTVINKDSDGLNSLCMLLSDKKFIFLLKSSIKNDKLIVRNFKWN